MLDRWLLLFCSAIIAMPATTCMYDHGCFAAVVHGYLYTCVCTYIGLSLGLRKFQNYLYCQGIIYIYNFKIFVMTNNVYRVIFMSANFRKLGKTLLRIKIFLVIVFLFANHYEGVAFTPTHVCEVMS